jgi:hypothetical protein
MKNLPKSKKPKKPKALPKPSPEPKPSPKPKASPKIKASPKTKSKRVVVPTVVMRVVEGPIPYLEAVVREQVSEDTMVHVFEVVRNEIALHQAKRVLVDLREGSVALTISDMLGLAKLVAKTFAGVMERLALLLRPQDVLDEKFFEPSVNSRGLPTFVTTDPAEAAYWIAAKLRQVR